MLWQPLVGSSPLNSCCWTTNDAEDPVPAVCILVRLLTGAKASTTSQSFLRDL